MVHGAGAQIGEGVVPAEQSAWKDWELSAAAEIWLQMPPFLNVRKNGS